MIFYSSFEPIYLLLPLFGFIIGLFGTMLGGGGGFFFLPILTLLMGAPPHVAVATSLAATLPICVVGSWGHYKKGNIEMNSAWVFAFAGSIGAFLGAGLTGLMNAKQLKMAFGVYCIIIAANLFYSTWKQKKKGMEEEQRSANNTMARFAKGSFYGISAGLIAGTFGTSGTAPVLAGLFSMRLAVKTVVGTSLLVVLVNTLFALGAHFLVGQIDLTLVGFLTVGSIIGAFAGTRFLSRVTVDRKENNIRYIYAVVIVGIGILMVIK